MTSQSQQWSLRAGYVDGHPTITESTTGVVACGDSWCTGKCGLPALALGDQRALGAMVACGPVFQPFRRPWRGEIVQVTVPEGVDVSGRFWP